jgi:hypothetical protein
MREQISAIIEPVLRALLPTWIPLVAGWILLGMGVRQASETGRPRRWLIAGAAVHAMAVVMWMLFYGEYITGGQVSFFDTGGPVAGLLVLIPLCIALLTVMPLRMRRELGSAGRLYVWLTVVFWMLSALPGMALLTWGGFVS